MRSLCAWTGMKHHSGNLRKRIHQGQILGRATQESLQKTHRGDDATELQTVKVSNTVKFFCSKFFNCLVNNRFSRIWAHHGKICSPLKIQNRQQSFQEKLAHNNYVVQTRIQGLCYWWWSVRLTNPLHVCAAGNLLWSLHKCCQAGECSLYCQFTAIG